MADSIVTKFCRSCKQTKDTSDFYKKNGKYLHKFCKVCTREINNAIHKLTRKSKRPFKSNYSDNEPFHFLVPYKRCSGCSTFKAGDKFCSNKRRADGLSDWCRDCHKQRNDKLKTRRQRLAAQPKPVLNEKTCTVCRVVKQTSEFYKNKHHSSGYNSSCKVCTEKSTKRKNEKSKQRVKKRYKCKRCEKIMWRRADYREWRGLCLKCLKPRNENSISAQRRKWMGRGDYREWRKAVLRRDDYMCQTCGSSEQLEADHVLPWSTHPDLRFELSNGRTLCNPCHRKTPTYGSGAKKHKQSNSAIPLMPTVV